MEITQQEIAELVVAELDKCGWSPDGPGGDSGEICLEEAIARVATKISGIYIAWTEIEGSLYRQPVAFTRFWKRLTVITRENFVRIHPSQDALWDFSPYEWNDDPRVSREDVILAVKQAGEAA